MSFSQRLIVTTFKAITSLICRIDDVQLAKIPAAGPLIIYTNHVNLLEIPIFYTHMQPRRFHVMVLAKRFNNPFLRWLLEVAEAIPLRRGEADVAALREGLAILKKGEMLTIAPEGTRSHDGRLRDAHAGVILLALRSGAPIIPAVFHGAERYQENLKRLRRTDFHIEVGKPFHLHTRGEKVTRVVRKEMLDEMMVQLALLLPQEQRGQYGRTVTSEMKYLVFDSFS